MPDFDLKQGLEMKKLVLTAALLLISASAYAGTYNFEGVTVNLQDGCRSASCVSVNAPGYGSYNGKALSAKRFGEGAQVPQGRHPVCFDHQNRCRAVATPAVDAAPAKLPEPAPRRRLRLPLRQSDESSFRGAPTGRANARVPDAQLRVEPGMTRSKDD